MIDMVRPKYFMPVHGSPLDRRYHQQVAIQAGISEGNALMINNGDILEYKDNKLEVTGKVPIGAHLVDQTGNVVPDLVIHDRLLMSEDGIVVVVLTVDRKNSQLLTSPDIITRGFIYMKENEDLMNELRNELRRFSLRRFSRVDLVRCKQELRDHVNNFLYKNTQRSPIIIPVVNAIGAGQNKPKQQRPQPNTNAKPHS
jgi:ribonuclease J